ncbi:condensation domain-containing protein, partial [Streptomyces sp. 130]|uniref:condensation domain-containing protein n=1 Tax=Streptomyces sp. 130 TaxID=2591006 RepID=UPI00163DDC06
MPVSTGATKFDLTLHLTPGESGGTAELSGAFEYSADLFDRSTVQQLQQRFTQLLDAVVCEPDRPLSRLDVLLPGECAALEEWNSTGVEVNAGSIPEVFAEQVARVPGALAVEFGEVRL